MKILIVCSGNAPNFNFPIHQAFIYDQIESICREDQSIQYETFFVKGKGIQGYLNSLKELKHKITGYEPNAVHAHGGHIGVLCGLQRIKPVIVTFHGSDINFTFNRFVSQAALILCKMSIYVSENLQRKVPLKMKKAEVIPCGVDFDIFNPVEKGKAKKELGFSLDDNYLLFSSSFDNPIKNFNLVEQALPEFQNISIEEIKDRSRQEVNLLMNGAEALILTSFSEGSPQVIKEAMACNIPIVATDVGDIRDVISNTEGCYITSFDPKDIAEKLKMAIAFGKRTNGRENIKHLDNKIISEKIIEVYKKVTSDE